MEAPLTIRKNIAELMGMSSKVAARMGADPLFPPPPAPPALSFV